MSHQDPVYNQESLKKAWAECNDAEKQTLIAAWPDCHEAECVQAVVKDMLDWFHANYEDPAENMPYESAEGGYQWVCGGPYSADEELNEKFDAVPQCVRDVAIGILDEAGYEWAPVMGSEKFPDGGDDDDKFPDEDEDDDDEDEIEPAPEPDDEENP